MTAVFSLDLSSGPEYVDQLGIAAGYGVLSVPVTGMLPLDVVNIASLTIQGTGLTTIQLSVDNVMRAQGYFEWTDGASVDAHFSLSVAQIAAIAAATNVTYNVTLSVTRSGNAYTREVQAGNLSTRPAIPTAPLIVNTIVITGGPAIGGVGQQVQLAATGYDGLGNIVSGITFAWSSSTPSVATVDQTGKVTFVGIGGATITATSYGVSAFTPASCTPTPYALGGIFYAQTINQLSTLPIGTANQFLVVNGGATAPQWHTLTAADVGAGTYPSGDFTYQGRLLFSADNVNDIGASGATRPRDAYIGRNLIVGGTTTLNGIAYSWPGSQAANRVLKTDGAGNLTWSTPTAEIQLEDLTDVTIMAVADKDHLIWNAGSSKWVNSTDGSTLTALNATQLTSGTVPNARVVGAYTNVTGLGTLAADLLFTDATYDIGKTGATRPRDGFFSRNVTIGNILTYGGVAINPAVTGTGTLVLSASPTLTGTFTLGGTTITTSTVTATNLAGTLTTATQNSVTTMTGLATVGALSSGSIAAGFGTIGGGSIVSGFGGARFGGNVIADSDNTYDIGANGATRFRDLWLARNASISGTLGAGATTVTSASAAALTVGRQGATTPAFQVDGSTSLQVSGIKITGDVTGGTPTIAAIDSGATANIKLDAKGTGTIGIGTISTGLITLGSSVTHTSGTTVTLTGVTVAGAPTWSSNQAITLSTAAQPNVTSVGTLAANLLFVDNTYDIGQSGATRPRHLYLSGNIVNAGSVTGVTTITASSVIRIGAGTGAMSDGDLQVRRATSDGVVYFGDVAGSGNHYLHWNGTTFQLGDGPDPLTIAALTATTITASGQAWLQKNTGIGTNPANYADSTGVGFAKLNVGGNAMLLGQINIGAGTALSLLMNADLNAGATQYTYISSDLASRYYQNAGSHFWSTAVSGSPGASITWTAAMSLSAASGLVLGTLPLSGVTTLGISNVMTLTGDNIGSAGSIWLSSRSSGSSVYLNVPAGYQTALLLNNGSAITFHAGGVVGAVSGVTTLNASGAVTFTGIPSEGSSQNALCIVNATGAVQQNNTTTCLVSSRRFKDGITPLGLADAWAMVDRYEATSYVEKDGGRPGFGLLSEDMLAIHPTLAALDQDGQPHGTNYEFAFTALVPVVQHTYRSLTTFDERLAALAARMDKYDARVQ